MRIITTIGLDLAKKVFHVHGVDAEGNVVVARRLRRKEVLAFLSNLTACLVGIEALEHNGVGLPGVGEGGMPGRDEQ